MSAQSEGTGITPTERTLMRTVFPFLVLLLAPLPAFWYGFENLARAWTLPEFRLKAFVPVLCLLMLLQAMRSIPERAIVPRERWPGTVLVGLALLLAIVGNIALVSHFLYGAIILYVAGVLVIRFGVWDGLLFWAPVGCLVLMVPIPMFLYRVVYDLLAGITAEIALWALWVVGATAAFEGDFLYLGSLSLRLRDATSGLLHFLPMMLVFFFFAAFHRGPFWLRLLPLLLTAPLLIVLSALRLVGIGLIAKQQHVPTAMAFAGLSDGWPFFFVAAAILFGLLLLAVRLSGASRSLEWRLDIDIPEMVRQVGRLAPPAGSGALVTAALLALLVGAAVLAAPPLPSAAVDREMLTRFPPEIHGWSGSRSGLSAETEATLKATDHLSMDFHHPEESAQVNLWIAYYLAQEPTKRPHSPEACLPGDGWNFLSRQIVTLSLPGADGIELAANRAVIRRGDATALMLYWYEGRGRRTASDVLARMEYLFDGLAIGRTDGALVRFVTPIGLDAGEEHAEARLLRLISATEDQLPRFIPQ